MMVKYCPVYFFPSVYSTYTNTICSGTTYLILNRISFLFHLLTWRKKDQLYFFIVFISKISGDRYIRSFYILSNSSPDKRWLIMICVSFPPPTAHRARQSFPLYALLISLIPNSNSEPPMSKDNHIW